MDEVKALEENSNTNGEGSANLVTNGELESQTEVSKTDIDNQPNDREVSGNALPEQDTMEEPAIDQEASTDPKPLDSPIDDRLTSSQEPLIQDTEETHGTIEYKDILGNCRCK